MFHGSARYIHLATWIAPGAIRPNISGTQT